jgi:hypothetical protein
MPPKKQVQAAKKPAARQKPPPTKLIYCICPLCGLSQKLQKTGYKGGEAKGMRRFEVDLANYPFIEFRQVGGRIAGLPRHSSEKDREKSSIGFFRVGGLTLKEALQSGEYTELIEAIESQAEAILKVIHSKRKIK